MSKLYNWVSTSNRGWHLLGVYIVSLCLGWASGVTAIVCLETKDVLHAKSIKAWSWSDCLAGVVGCALGGLVHWITLKHW